MATNFPKVFPREELAKVLERFKNPTQLQLSDWVEIMRHASYCLGCLVTLFKKELPPDLSKMTQGAGPPDCSHLVEPESNKQPTQEEIVYLVHCCKQVLSETDMWVAPATLTSPATLASAKARADAEIAKLRAAKAKAEAEAAKPDANK